jgi:thiol:disulfide interchange protein
MPGWLVGLLAVVGVAILGPPVLVLLFVALGLVLKVGVVALKVSVLVLAVAAVVFVLRAMFGSTPTRQLERSPSNDSIEAMAARLEAEELERREALDRQLAEAMQSPR